MHQDRGDALRDAVVYLAKQSLPLGGSRIRPRPLLGLLVQPCIDYGDGGMSREQLEEPGVGVGEAAARVAAEHDARPDDRAAPSDRYAYHPVQRRTIGRRDVATRNQRVVGEEHRSATSHHSTRHPLRQRKAPPGLTGDPDIGFLAVDPRGLVDTADGAGIAPEQLHRTLQDALEQRSQRELPRKILHNRRDRIDPGLNITRDRSLSMLAAHQPSPTPWVPRQPGTADPTMVTRPHVC
jgi:hypothetical protein